MNRTTAWNKMGTSVTSATTMTEALNLSGLNFHVVGRPVNYMNVDGENINLPGIFANVREDDMSKCFGVVNHSYSIVDNKDAFAFIDNIASIRDDITFLKAGMTHTGMSYVISQLGEVDILGDKVRPHLIFQNGFDAKTSLKANICMLRIVCQNQFAGAFKNAANAISLRHRGEMEYKLEDARATLEQTYEYLHSYNNFAETLVKKRLNDKELQNIISTMFLNGKTIDEVKDPRGNIEADINMFKNAYIDDDNANFTGTAWGVLNAWTDYITHVPSKNKATYSEERRFLNASIGSTKTNQMVKMLEAI